MEHRQVKGNTFVLEGNVGLIPYYHVGSREIVLLDSGDRARDGDALLAWLKREGLHVRAVIGTHIHTDHSGNHTALQRRGAEIILPLIEAAVGQSPVMGKSVFFTSSPGQVEDFFGSMLTKADRVILPGETEVAVCGAVFRIIPLPGHTAGHIGIVTPDDVCYVGDALMSESVLQRAKLPTSLSYAMDIESKQALRAQEHDWYILAHRGVYSSILDLIQRNLDSREERVQAVASLLHGEMTVDEISHAVWQALDMHTQRPDRIAAYRRNLCCVLDYLCDRGDVARKTVEGITRFRRVSRV